ncbi:hypothetical protein D3C76_1766940 [compost metagenome]
MLEQTQGFSLGAGLVLLVETGAVQAHHSLALNVTNSPLRHLAALAVTALSVLVRPSCNCWWAANTITTL